MRAIVARPVGVTTQMPEIYVEGEAANFSSRLAARAATSHQPSTAIQLKLAVKFFGGEAKPWGAILKAMLSGQLQFWLKPASAFTRGAHVLLKDVRLLSNSRFDEQSWPSFAFEKEFTQHDALEILNLTPTQLFAVISAGELAFRRDPTSLKISRNKILDLAAKRISISEAALRLGCHSNLVSEILDGIIPRYPSGWDRATFLRDFSRRLNSP